MRTLATRSASRAARYRGSSSVPWDSRWKAKERRCRAREREREEEEGRGAHLEEEGEERDAWPWAMARCSRLSSREVGKRDSSEEEVGASEEKEGERGGERGAPGRGRRGLPLYT